ncbi:MAG TPA: hypothetical protein VE669_11730 [Actinomycetota bacterium]|nr:hypothetical protein [Actinomycetota bacterium]
MRLTWRDGVTTLLAAFVVAVAFAVTQGWDWPLLGSVRAGVGALGIAGIVMCSMGGATMGEDTVKGPYGTVGAVLGVGALALLIWGLVAPADAILVALAIDIVALWLLSTVRHSVTHPSRPVTAH